MRWKLKAGPVAVPQKEHVESLFIQQARRRQTLHSSPVRLAQGPREENLWKEHSPQPQDYVERLCVYIVCEEPCVRPYAAAYASRM